MLSHRHCSENRIANLRPRISSFRHQSAAASDRSLPKTQALFSHTNQVPRAWLGAEYTVYNIKSGFDSRRRSSGQGSIGRIWDHGDLSFDPSSALRGNSVRSLYRRLFRYHRCRRILPDTGKAGVGVWRSFRVDRFVDHGDGGHRPDVIDRSERVVVVGTGRRIYFLHIQHERFGRHVLPTPCGPLNDVPYLTANRTNPIKINPQNKLNGSSCS